MNKVTSLYLDLIRFIAALLVLFSHALTFEKIYIPVISDCGSEAVVAFFILSGYVISFVSSEREKNPLSYFKARCIRIYSVLIPAIFFGALLDNIGLFLNKSYYFSHQNFYNDFSFETLFRILTFSGEFLNFHMVYGANEPIWSIQFECIYYIIFGLIIFFPKNIYAWILLFIILTLSFPKVLFYFPIWLMGVFIHRVRCKLNNSILVFLLSICFLLIVRFFMGPRQAMFTDFSFTLDGLYTIFYYYLIGFGVAVNILASERFLIFVKGDLLLLKYENLIRFLASNTFSLYLTHLPMMMLICVLIPPVSLLNSITGMIVLFLFCFIFSFIFENKSGPMFKFYRKMSY